MYQHWRLLTCQLNEIYMTVKFSKLRSQYPWSFDCETAPSTVRAATVLNYNFPISSQTKTVAKKTIIFNPIVQFLAFDCHIKCAPLLLRWRIRGDFYGFDGNRATFCNALCQEYSSHFLAISETIFAANILTGAKPQLSHLSQYRQRQQESTADAVKPARRKSMPKLLQFDVFRFISPNFISPKCQCIASRLGSRPI